MIPVRVTADPNAIPLDAAVSADDVSLLIQTSDEWNFGTLLGDSVFTAFMMQNSFGISNARILRWDRGYVEYQGKNWDFLVTKIFKLISKDDQTVGSQILASPEFFRGLLNNSRNHKTEARQLCFPV